MILLLIIPFMLALPLLLPLAFFAPVIIAIGALLLAISLLTYEGVKMIEHGLGRASVYNRSYGKNITKGFLQALSGNLTGLKLQRMDLNCLQMEKTNLSGSNLKGANLCGSNMKDCNITDTLFRNAIFDIDTILPFSFEMALSKHMIYQK
jgi:hypothetical protein